MRWRLLTALAATLLLAAAAEAVVVRRGDLRITALARVAPYKLPRSGTAPIAVYVAGHLAAVDGGIPPQLQRLDIEVNRHSLLRSAGLPACPLSRIKTASTTRALRLCGGALIGSGRFWAHIVFADQQPYPTHGRLLIFNSRRGAQPLLLAHIFTSNPFPSSFVIAFAIRHLRKGPYGTELSATLPQALGSWGYVDRIKLNLKRTYRYRGRELSYFNAGCPAEKGTDRTVYPLALSTFSFRGLRPIQVLVTKSCGVRA